MTDDLPQYFPFLTFKTKQNVSKSKLDGEFAKKGWNDFSHEFSKKVQETSFIEGDEPIKKKLKIDPGIFKKQILTEGCKPKQRNPVIEHKEADFFASKAEDFCNLIQNKSLQVENRKELKAHNFNRCPNSVFLEVRNIWDSYQQNKSTLQPKFGLKCPDRNFIAYRGTKKAGGQENVPSKKGCQFNFQNNDFPQDRNIITVKKAGGQEYVPSKSGSQFNFQGNDFLHSVSIKKVQRTNVFSSLVKQNLTVINNISESITNPSYSKKNDFSIKNSDSEKFLAKVERLDQNRNKNVSFNLSALFVNESSKDKGSNWLQSLQISDSEAASENAGGRKRIRNILPGGFAEQMLKLQRIEKSEEVIWDHDVDGNKKKGKYLPLVLISFSSTGGMVIAKCRSLRNELSADGFERNVEEPYRIFAESKQVVMLLKKSVFNKLQLKTQCIFHLYPPWQIIHLPQISRPVILCAKFIDLNSCKGNGDQDSAVYGHPISSSSSAFHQASNCFNEISHPWEQPVSLSVRIQRIWKVETTNSRGFAFTSIQNYFRYSLLIQEQNGIFFELVLSSTHFLPDSWKEFISEAEGKCYEFRDLHLVHRLCLDKHPQFSRVLDLISMSQEGTNGFRQEFCYQLAFHSCSPLPEAISDEGFPVYCPMSPQPLASLFRETNIQRFTCVAKIIFQFRKTIYLCDDSVPKYVPLASFPVASEHPLVGSSVLIRDAQLLEGYLFLDKFSSFIHISKESQLKQMLGNRLNQFMNVTLRSIIPEIDVTSQSSMFVFIKGEVIGVDTDKALSWLQCNLCLSDSLVQDSRLVIYCENCLQVVPKPVLNVKMSVTCQCSPHVKVEVELLSKSSKRILQINDNTHQPWCNVDDVLGKQVGPLLCCIESSASVGNVKQFRASEVEMS